MAEEDFERFWQDQFTEVVVFLMRQRIRFADAEDAVQEAMTAAYKSWSTLRNPHAWVRVVAKREFQQATTRLHKQRAREHAVAHGADTGVFDDDLGVLRQDQQAIVSLLRRLPHRQREVMAWHIDGFKPAEIADHLNERVETVRSNLRHARQALKGHIAQDGYWNDVGGAS